MREDLDDEAYLRLLGSVEDEIARCIGVYIPWRGHEYDDRAEMDFILFKHAFRLHTFDPKKAAKDWTQVCQKARELQRLWQELDYNAQSELYALVSTEPLRLGGAQFKNLSSYDLWQFLNLGGDLLTEREEEGRQLLNRGTSAGRRNIRSIAVVHACRIVWERRTGRAPSISMRAFGDFLAEIFAALEPIGMNASPEAAYKAWDKFVER